MGRPPRRLALLGLGLAALAALAAAPGPAAGAALGPYLSARMAEARFDLAGASEFAGQARQAAPHDESLLHWEFALAVSAGRRERSLSLAREILTGRREASSGAVVRVAADALGRGDWDGARALFGSLRNGGVDGLLRGAGLAWTAVGSGAPDPAAGELSGPEGLGSMAAVQRALLLDAAGRAESARVAFVALERRISGLSAHEARIVARFFLKEGEAQRARNLVARYLEERRARRPLPEDVRRRLERDRDTAGRGAGEALVRSPAAGFAELLYALARLHAARHRQTHALFQARLARMADPGHDGAQLLIGRILAMRDRHEEAVAAYDAVAPDSPERFGAELQAALSMDALERTDAAVERLEALAGAHPDEIQPLATLADVLRWRERFDEAIGAYDRAVARIPGEPDRRHWRLFYGRGIALERVDEWPRAKADLLQALAFAPDAPYLLNYLGYSWIIRGEEFARAEEMLLQAVALRRNDGFIADSLGWIYHLTGRADDAVRELERAIVLEPGDPVINEHLGDAYWRVGRRKEAGFQWRRALAMEPDEDRLEGLAKRLECGLDCVPDERAARTDR